MNSFLGNNSLAAPPPILSTTVQQQRKHKVLVWSDAVVATTGFGTVARHILKALHNTGKYDIDQLGINYFGDFYDKEEIPYTIVPARLGNPQDPYGNQMFINSLQKKDYDIVFIINDTFVVEEVAKYIDKIRDHKKQHGKKLFKLVYYYPVDCKFLESASTMVKVADRAVAYTNFAKESTVQVEGCRPTDVIYHGTDTNTYKPLSASEIAKYRKQYLKISDPDRFLIINVNRNSIRKDIARSILAFKEFRKEVPNSALYLHTVVKDGMGGHVIDLEVCVRELGLNTTEDVIFPRNYSAAKGFPEYVLNQLYNCADAYITTNLGEGWGLTITEAMAAGTPVIAPNHTTAPEILGPYRSPTLPLDKNSRGYIYDCKEKVYVDNSGYRKWGRMEDILAQMILCYNDWKCAKKGRYPKARYKARETIIKNAREFTEKYSWNNVCKQWIKLFEEVSEELSKPEKLEPVGEQL